MTTPAWFAVAFAVPVLLLGEQVVRRTAILSRFNIPAPVAGGLLIALIVLVGNLSGWFVIRFETSVTARWWTWLVTIEPDWVKAPSRNVNQPFLVAFFTCIGLNASWSLVRRGSWPLFLFLLLSALLAVVQNLVAVPLAEMLGSSPLLGLVCGSLTLTGGVGTALGFAPELEKAGLPNAAVVSVAAATFGLVAGGLLGGPLGGFLIRKHQLKSDEGNQRIETATTSESGILSDCATLFRYGRRFAIHLLVLLLCIKGGAWVSSFIQQTNISFPIYMGALLLGVVVRNVSDAFARRTLSTEIVDTLGSVTLAIFLAIAMMSLNLAELANTAVPMLIILSVQIVLMGLFAWLVTFPLMGRSYDAAIMAAGQVGFSLGATPNAVANMKALVEKFGPSPRAFLVVPVVGGFLIDFLNAINITVFINLLKQ